MKALLSRFHRILFATLVALSVTSQGYSDTVSHHCLDPQAVYGTTTTFHHGSAVEPTIAVNPKNKKQIVAAWQQDRFSNASALEIGISYSNDGGRTWHKSRVPFQICDGGISQRVGDTWLSYAKDGSKVYLCNGVLNATKVPHTQKQFGIVVNISKDNGATWSKPRYLVSSMNYLSEPTRQFANFDKDAITADPNDKRQVIAVWSLFNPNTSAHGDTQASISADGGKSWSQPAIIYDPFPDLTQEGLSNGLQNDNHTGNNVVVILPKKEKSKKRRLSGDWLNFTVRGYAKPGASDTQYTNDKFPFQYSLTDIAVVRSKNQGKSWEPHATVIVPSFVNNLLFTGGYTYDAMGNITGFRGKLMRDDQTLPSYNVNPKNGFLYVVYQTSELRKDSLAQIALVTSRDGGKTWSKPARVSRTPMSAANPQAFEPFVAITKKGRVGVLYFDFRHDDNLDPDNHTKMDAWLAIYQEVKDPKGGSTKIGLDFVKEIRLSEKSYIAQNGPTTTQGLMTDGDYQFLTARGECFYAIYTKALNGPFKPVTTFFTDPAHNATLLLDDNKRTVPFVSIIKNHKKGAHLLLTKKLKYTQDR